jgi:transcriptional regulator with XRE-family HTH domain
MMTGRFRRADEIPQDRAAVVGANIRVLRQQHGWNQAKLGELMGWPSNSTVCAAEGRRNGRQRGFTTEEVERLAAIFGVPPSQLTMECANCGGHPAGRVRLPDLRSPAPGMKPRSTSPVKMTVGRSRRSPRCFDKAVLPLTSEDVLHRPGRPGALLRPAP